MREPKSAEELDLLVARAQRGEGAAFDEIVLALHGELALSLVGFQVSEGLAEEVLQATFVTAYQKLGAYEVGRLTLRAWLKTIARNHLLKELRDQRRFAERSGEPLKVAVVDTALEDAARFEAVETAHARLRDCLDRLAEPARRLVEDRYLRRQPVTALAQREQRPERWVSVRLFRIRQALRRCMEDGTAPEGGAA
jgi:RNA polymerase sigma-70 factor (ECF subfamily)